ncbi:MAG: hypothetical protein E4H14_11235 [Candidatus Thorarchaeota archaeon]|nr:MAG: hypothetical protein E4H14_11235 [Candidatus Thorarchaeota archaeon]
MTHVLLVEPAYYTRYPPLGLLKLATHHRNAGHSVELTRGIENGSKVEPDMIEVTSLFTYAWKPVHEAIKFYSDEYPRAQIRVGGIYASLMPNRIKKNFPFVEIHHGLYPEAESLMPAYDLLANVDRWEDWDASILFTSRGCIRRCPFCVVPRLEGSMRSMITDAGKSIYPNHNRVILWDNNFLASKEWKKTLQSLIDTGLTVDFNQGLDARLMDEEKASMLADLPMPIVRMAYDRLKDKKHIERAIELLSNSGIRKRSILFYTLFNYYEPRKKKGDTPETFLQRVREVLELGSNSYPMRYEPPTSLVKNKYVSPLWTASQLEQVARARRVIGYGGAFPPYKGLITKLDQASSFDEAFSLRSPT